MDLSIFSSYLRPHIFVNFFPVSLSTCCLSYRSLPWLALLNSFISFPLCDDLLSLQSPCLQLNLSYYRKRPPSFSVFSNVKITWKPRALKICEKYLGTNYVTYLIKEIWKMLNEQMNWCVWTVSFTMESNYLSILQPLSYEVDVCLSLPCVLQHSAMKLSELTA